MDSDVPTHEMSVVEMAQQSWLMELSQDGSWT